MRTKLAVYCDRVLEAGWLIAVIIVPLFFNVYSSRVFEPDKLSILRSIAVVMSAAWLIKVLDGSTLGQESRVERSGSAGDGEGVGIWSRLIGTPLVLPTLLLVGAYTLSTILSVAPRISLWGSYMRLQGTYTTFSYIVIFFLMLMTVRRREQVNRLVTAIILTSLPISLYGILQHYNKDSLPWSGDVTMRVAGNMGNAIFVAAYLIMTFPITLARLLDSFSSMFREQDGGLSHAILAGCYAFVLAVTAVCIFFTQSRGPWLGLMGGVYVFMLITLVSLRHGLSDQSQLTVRDVLRALAFAVLSIPVGVVPAYAAMVILKRGLRWLWLSLVIQTLLIGSLLLFFNLPNTPLSPLRELPYLGRLGNLLQTEGGTGKVRVLIWQGALDMIAASPFRAIVGYGPETMHVAYNPYYPPDLAHYEARNASPDRAHNETIDALAITGVIGFAIQMMLFGSLFYFGLKWLGFMGSDRERKWFWTLSLGGALGGALLPRLLEGTFILSGVGLPVGFIVGMSVYLMLSAAFFYKETGRESGLLRSQLLPIALFSAIVAHFIEIHFGIAIASTRVHFWVYAAILVLLGLNRVSDPVAEQTVPEPAEHEPPPHTHFTRKSQRQARRIARQQQVPATPTAAPPASLTPKVLAISLVVAVILLTLAFDFVTNPMGELDTVRIIQLSLTTLAPKGEAAIFSPGVLLMLFLTWLVGGLVSIAEVERSSPTRQGTLWWLSAVGTYVAITLAVFFVGAALHASSLRPGNDIANTITLYNVNLAILGLLIAMAMTTDSRLPGPFFRTANLWIYPILLALALVVAFATNISIIKADVYYKQGLRAEEAQRWELAVNYYSRAISMAPSQDYYYLFLGRSLVGQAQATSDVTKRTSYFEQSVKALDSARQLNPLNTDHFANLGRMYRNWAEYATTSEDRAAKLALCHTYYEQAIRLSPRNAQLYNEWALVYMAQGDYVTADQKLQESLALDQQFANTYLISGNLASLQGNVTGAADAYAKALDINPEDAEAWSALGYAYYQQGNITEALSANLKALDIDPKLARAHSTLGLIYFDTGRLDEAISENLKVLEAYPNDLISHRNLALLYQRIGNIDDALTHARRTLELSSDIDKPTVQQFIDQLEAQKAGR